MSDGAGFGAWVEGGGGGNGAPGSGGDGAGATTGGASAARGAGASPSSAEQPANESVPKTTSHRFMPAGSGGRLIPAPVTCDARGTCAPTRAGIYFAVMVIVTFPDSFPALSSAQTDATAQPCWDIRFAFRAARIRRPK